MKKLYRRQSALSVLTVFRKTLFFLVFLFAFVKPGNAQTPEDGFETQNPKSLISESKEPSNLINAVSVSGLRRTKQSIIDRILKKYIGQDASQVDFNDVKAAIKDSGILEPESVSLIPSATGQTLAVTVHEKWSIILAPLVTAGSNGSFMAGLAFSDMNALGLNDKLVLAAFYTRSDESAGGLFAAMYTHNTQEMMGFRNWTVGLNYALRDSKVTDQRNDRKTHQYNSHTIAASFMVSYPLQDELSVNLGVSFNDKIINKTSYDINPPDKDAPGIGLSPGVNFKRSEYDGYLMSRQAASFSYSSIIGIDYDTIHQLSFKGDFEKSVIPGFKMMFSTGILFSPYTTLLFAGRPSSITPILPNSFISYHYAGGRAGFEKYIFKWEHGTLSVLANYQIIWTDGPDFGNQFDHGISGTLCFYLARIAIPAVTFGVNYNVQANYFSTSFSVGMSF